MTATSALTAVRWGAAILAVAALVLAGAAWWPIWFAPSPEVVISREPDDRSPRRAVTVYVSGAVRQPGVVELRDGDRIERALAAAGGATEDADLDRINLALRLRDEQQVHVPRRGEVTAAIPPAASALLNLNTAGVEQLMALRGIGEVRARSIVDYRSRNGPFRSIDELVTARLIPASVLAQIRDQIAVD